MSKVLESKCWEPKSRQLGLPLKECGTNWEECLKVMKTVVTEYLAEGEKRDALKTTEGIDIGFVDGDLEILWRP